MHAIMQRSLRMTLQGINLGTNLLGKARFSHQDTLLYVTAASGCSVCDLAACQRSVVGVAQSRLTVIAEILTVPKTPSLQSRPSVPSPRTDPRECSVCLPCCHSVLVSLPVAPPDLLLQISWPRVPIAMTVLQLHKCVL